MNTILEDILFYNNHNVTFTNISEKDYQTIGVKLVSLINGHFKKKN